VCAAAGGPHRWQASRQTVLFYTPDTEPLARRIAAQEGFDIELAHISWDKFQVRNLPPRLRLRAPRWVGVACRVR
jgi:hypothetical protein